MLGEPISFVVKSDVSAKYARKISSKTGLSSAGQQCFSSSVHWEKIHGKAVCGCSNETAPQRLRCVNTGSGVGGALWARLRSSAAMLEEVCHREETWRVYGPTAPFSLLPVRGWGGEQAASCSCCAALRVTWYHASPPWWILIPWNHTPPKILVSINCCGHGVWSQQEVTTLFNHWFQPTPALSACWPQLQSNLPPLGFAAISAVLLIFRFLHHSCCLDWTEPPLN